MDCEGNRTRQFHLQLIIRYMLAILNPQQGKSWGVSLGWFTSKQHKGYFESTGLSHINKAWKVMVEGLYHFPPHTLMEPLNSDIWWLDDLELIINGFTFARAHELYRKRTQCIILAIWLGSSIMLKAFIPLEAKRKMKLLILWKNCHTQLGPGPFKVGMRLLLS